MTDPAVPADVADITTRADEMTRCPSCNATVGAAERFCEACGAELSPTLTATEPPLAEESPLGSSAATPVPDDLSGTEPNCRACGGEVSPDGYCGTCGARATRRRDHFTEHPARWVAAVCDRGIRHHRNEDAMALSADSEPGSRAVLVVCDGVSSSVDSDLASLAASRAARDVLVSSRSRGMGAGPSLVGAVTARLEAAADAASEAVLEVTRRANDVATRGNGGTTAGDTPAEGTTAEGTTAEGSTAEGSPVGGSTAGANPVIPHPAALSPVLGSPDSPAAPNPASCTFVAAVVDRDLLVVGSVGDSRAYWLPDVGVGTMLTTDDSFAQEQIASGIPRAEAEVGPQSHAITRWLGQDAPDHKPATATMTLAEPGWLLVCSDGLWNYCSAASDMAALVRQILGSTAAAEPLALAGALVDWANAQGGHDNITVALARVDPNPTAPTREEARRDG